LLPEVHWHITRAGLEREIFDPAASDLLAQAAWLDAARSGSLTIQPEHIHKALP
jgi:hypothetical protein